MGAESAPSRWSLLAAGEVETSSVKAAVGVAATDLLLCICAGESLRRASSVRRNVGVSALGVGSGPKEVGCAAATHRCERAKMDEGVRIVSLRRSESFGLGFSILGGAGSELPPIIYDIIEDSPAAESGQVRPPFSLFLLTRHRFADEQNESTLQP